MIVVSTFLVWEYLMNFILLGRFYSFGSIKLVTLWHTYFKSMMKQLTTIALLLLLCITNSYAQGKYALLVGISNYHALDKASEWNNIHGVNDVSLITPLLKKQGFNVSVITETKATHDNILMQLKQLTKRVSRGAVVYLHFSCHGQPFEDENGDEEDGWDESLVPIDAPIAYKKGVYEGENHITDDLLAEYLDALRFKLGSKGKLYVVIDACHAGKASRNLDEETFTRGTKRGFSKNGKVYRAKSSRSTHFVVPIKEGQAPAVFLEACKSTQVNAETKKNGKFYGPMSYYIHQVLSTTRLGHNDAWIYKVQDLMRKEIDAKRQDMVIEISK